MVLAQELHNDSCRDMLLLQPTVVVKQVLHFSTSIKMQGGPPGLTMKGEKLDYSMCQTGNYILMSA